MGLRQRQGLPPAALVLPGPQGTASLPPPLAAAGRPLVAISEQPGGAEPSPAAGGARRGKMAAGPGGGAEGRLRAWR